MIFGILTAALAFQAASIQNSDELAPRDWLADFQSARQLQERGDYVEAGKQFRAALKALGTFDAHDRRQAITRSYLGYISAALGNYGEAERWWHQQLRIEEGIFGRSSPALAGCLTDLAHVYAAQGKFAKAEETGRRALKLSPQSLHSTASIIGILGSIVYARGDSGEAEQLLLRSLAIAETLPPSDYDLLSRRLLELAALYRSEGSLDKAARFAERARQILEERLGSDHPGLFVPLEQIANIQARRGRYPDAIATMQRAVAVAEKGLGASSPRVGAALAAEARWLRNVKRNREADAVEKRAKAIFTSAGQGIGTPHTIDVRDVLTQNRLARVPE